MLVRTAEKVKTFDPTVWVDRYGDYLFALAFSRVRDRQTAEALVQETLLAAVQSDDSSAEKTSEKAWLGGILRLRIIDFFRAHCPADDLTEAEADMSSYQYLFADETWKDHWTENTMPVEWRTTPDEALREGAFCAVLENCLNELPRRVADAFTLHEMDGFDAPQICEILQVSSDNYHLMLHRARTHLRRCLEFGWFRKVNI